MHKLIVSLSLALAVAGLGCEPAVEGAAPGFSPTSGPIALTADDRLLVIAAEDHDEVLVVDAGTRAVLRRVAVADAPSHLIVEGNLAIVTSRYGHAVSVVDIERGEVVSTIATGAEPVGLVKVADNVVAVALAGDGAVALVDIKAGIVMRTIPLQKPDPRAVALLPDGTLYVSHMSSGVFSRVDINVGSARLVDVNTPNAFGVRLIAEHQRSLTVDPTTGTVLMAHSQANADTVRAPIGGDTFGDEVPGGFGEGGCGYSGCQTELGAVVPGLTEVDPTTDLLVVPQALSTSDTNVDGAQPPGNGFDSFGGTFSAAPPSVLNPFEARFGGVPMSNPAAIALFDGGRGQLVVNLGTKNAMLLRRHLNGTASDVLGTAALGNGAASVVLSHDGKLAYVWNQFDGSVTEIGMPAVDSRNARSRFAEEQNASENVDVAELQRVPEVASRTFTVVTDALDANASLGRKMFHDATDPRVSAAGSVSCASCHPDGRTDGRTWQFTFGPRNTPQLGGDILDTAPFHWPGDVANVAALNEMTVKPFMGGAGLSPADFEFVAAFIGTIREAPSAAMARPELNASELRGQEVFASAETGCTACHSGGHFTDNGTYDIASAAHAGDIRAFQTPVLHGLHRSAPYFHDGKFESLEALVQIAVRGDTMGIGSHLTDDDADALVAYLKTL